MRKHVMLYQTNKKTTTKTTTKTATKTTTTTQVHPLPLTIVLVPAHPMFVPGAMSQIALEAFQDLVALHLYRSLELVVARSV